GSPFDYFRKVSRMVKMSRPLLEYANADYFLVVDGLNALMDWTLIHFPNATVREIMTCLESAFHVQRSIEYGQRTPTKLPGELKPKLVLLTAEDREDRSDRWSESYLADCLVQLGYETLRNEHLNCDETILKCRVPKGRNLHVQRRECCYDFDERVGVQFFESYAAEGAVALFHENTPQREQIDDFREYDTKAFFPKLNVSAFDRSNMFHEYAVRHHEIDVPPRRPMLVTNVDEYWVSGLIEKRLLRHMDKVELYDPSNGTLLEPLSAKLRALGIMTGDAQLGAVPHFLNPSLLVSKESGVNADRLSTWTWETFDKRCEEWKSTASTAECFPYLIETKTVDSFVATLLELFWSHGGGWHTKKRERQLEIKYWTDDGKVHDRSGVVRALIRFRDWLKNGIVRPYSTVDVRHPSNQSNEWLFARHWYSTLVDTLTAKDAKGDSISALQQRDVEVLRFPIAADCEHAVSATTSGDWYLAVEVGTENLVFAQGIIRNLMSVNKVVARAISGGGLPPIKEFYADYGKVRCFGTNKTFSEMLDIGEYTIDRSEFEEYRFILRHVYACGLEIMGSYNSMSDAEIDDTWARREELISAYTD
ncbi:MAG: hypothetical protein O3C17_15050, partial [Planctomycetota bacterium]|nr:hypothetical protein [Planctomycetota bacterium]